MSNFAKPENALQRANELVAVGHKETALNTLHEVITAKRHRTWQQVMEEIMLRYVELCVELQKGKMAKDGLIQYRMSCQHVNVGSLEVVIQHFLNTAENTLNEATAKAQALAGPGGDIDDEITPESLLMDVAKGADTREVSPCEIVAPWVKLLWESYRTVLDILRNNAKLESLYQGTAQRAFAYCKENKRMIEFKRLCDILRNHLSNLNKFTHQNQNVSLSNPETLQMMIETRLSQLEAASDLELWQEAFRSIEDIHSLMSLSKKALKSSTVRTYYEKLALIFWASENFLFHAHATYKRFEKTQKSSKEVPAEELQALASCTLLAALCVPKNEITKASQASYDFDMDGYRENGARMSTLLGLTQGLDRDMLLADLVNKNVLKIVPKEVAQLYEFLQVDFAPLELCGKVKPLIDALPEHLSKYAPALKKTVVMRLLTQLSEVYQAMNMADLEETLAGLMELSDVETIVVESVRSKHLHVRLSFQHRTINFGSDQDESGKVRGQLSILSDRLQCAVDMIHPELKEAIEEKKKQQLDMIMSEMDEEHKRILERKDEIERRKEIDEKVAMKKFRMEEARALKKRLAQEELEKSRLAAEAKSREELKEARLKEEEEKKNLILVVNDLLELPTMRTQFDTEEKLAHKKKSLLTMTADEIMQEKVRILTKQKELKDQRLDTQAKRLDHIERARRIMERPMLEEYWEKQKVLDRELYEALQAKKAQEARDKFDAAVIKKKQLTPLAAYKVEYQEKMIKLKTDKFAEDVEENKRQWEEDVARRREEWMAAMAVKKAERAEQEAREQAQAEHAAARLAAESAASGGEGAEGGWGEGGGRAIGAGDTGDGKRYVIDPSGNAAKWGRDAPAEGGGERPRFGGGGGFGGDRGGGGGGGGGGGWGSRDGGEERPRFGGGGGFGGDRGGGGEGGERPRFGGGGGFGGDRGGGDRDAPREERPSKFGGWGGGASREGGAEGGGERPRFGGGGGFGGDRGGGGGGFGDRGGDRDGGERRGGFGDRESKFGGGGWGGNRDAPREGGGDAPPARSAGGWGGSRGGDGGAAPAGGGGGWRSKTADKEGEGGGNGGGDGGGWRNA